MSYIKQVFVDGVTRLKAKHLQHIENGIGEASGGHWQGKIWYAYGTSFTSIASGEYVPFLEKFGGFSKVVNKGIPGGGICQNQNVKNAVMNTTDGKLEADLITLEVSANDVNVALGDIYDTGDDTFCGALNQCIRYLQRNTSAQIVILSSWVGRSTGSTAEQTFGPDNHTRFDQKEAVRKVCAVNCCPYIPSGEAGNMSYDRMNASDLYNVDALHHTELGGYNIAKFIWGYLKNIPLWYTSIPMEDTADKEETSTFTVAYNINEHGDSFPESVSGVVALPDPLPTITASGYIFGGWYYEMECETKAVAGTPITQDIVLYAKWTAENN